MFSEDGKDSRTRRGIT